MESAVLAATSHENDLHRNYPGVTALPMKSAGDMLGALLTGGVDAILGGRRSSTTSIKPERM